MENSQVLTSRPGAGLLSLGIICCEAIIFTVILQCRYYHWISTSTNTSTNTSTSTWRPLKLQVSSSSSLSSSSSSVQQLELSSCLRTALSTLRTYHIISDLLLRVEGRGEVASIPSIPSIPSHPIRWSMTATAPCSNSYRDPHHVRDLRSYIRSSSCVLLGILSSAELTDAVPSPSLVSPFLENSTSPSTFCIIFRRKKAIPKQNRMHMAHIAPMIPS
jgi:hypothetical protein